jgi:hypothetical protein
MPRRQIWIFGLKTSHLAILFETCFPFKTCSFFPRQLLKAFLMRWRSIEKKWATFLKIMISVLTEF